MQLLLFWIRDFSKGGVILETQHIEDQSNFGPDILPTQQLQPGSTLSNRYLIRSVIGVGGMGAVYQARDLHFPNVIKVVAVKEMVIQARDPFVRSTIVNNFEREANLLATLDHPAIPRIFDYFTHEEKSYLILEFINGKDLEAILAGNKSPMPESDVVRWSIELCDVLSYLHEHKPEPIIFRDMKPSNVMINHHAHVVLIDFGIARPFLSDRRGTMIGTEGYSPPEQYRGEASPLADIYALGATMHHLLTNRDPRLEPPFSFGERPIRKFNPAISTQLEAVTKTALQYNTSDRYQSAAEMKAALMAAARQTGVFEKIASTTSGLPRDLTAPKMHWTFQSEDEIRGTPTFHQGIILIGSYDSNMYALKSESGEFKWKYPTFGGVVSKPAVSDRYVFFGSEDHNLYAVDFHTGRLAWSYPTQGPIRSSPCLAEGHAFIGSDDHHLHAVNLLSGRMTWQVNVGSPVRSTPLVVNDYVYFGSESGDFCCLDFRGTIKWRFSAKRAITGSPINHQGVIYFNSLDGMLYALDGKSGWLIWRYRMGKGSISTPAIMDDFIFTGSADGNIYCLDFASAKKIWTFETGNQVTSSPLIHDDFLYCGSVDGSLYCLEYRSGRLRWKYNTGGPITGTAIIHNDRIFFGSTDHRIYGLATQ